MAVKRFPSKIDRWLVVVLLAVLAGQFALLVSVIRAGHGSLSITAWLIVTVGVFLLVGLTLSRTYYIVDERHLRIVCGVFYWSIPIKDIRSVEPTRSPWSSPALSLDRLRIRYGRRGSVLVSPEDKVRFMDALREPADGSGA